MAWTSPYTAIAGSAVTAAQYNQYVRDNLLQCMPAKAVTPGSYFAVTGLNAIAERVSVNDFITTSENVTSATYVDAPTVGPTAVVATATRALVIIGGRIGPVTTGATASIKMSWACSGATTIAAVDDWAAGGVALTTTGAVYISRWYLVTTLTPGTNTFRAKYASSSGTATFDNRSITVLPF